MFVVERTEALPVIPLEHRPFRSPGLHLSTILHEMCKVVYPERFDKPGGGEEEEWVGEDLDAHPKIWLGSAVDQYYDQTLRHRPWPSFRPAELVKDGIAMNPDRVSFEPARLHLPGDTDLEPIVEEHKLTWMSIYTGIEDKRFVHWFWQDMAYAFTLESLRGRIRAFTVNNDYRPPTPKPHVYDVLYTYAELEMNWRRIYNFAARRGWLAPHVIV